MQETNNENNKSNRKNRKSSNPLYVVRNNGVDVEEANNFIDMLLKKNGH